MGVRLNEIRNEDSSEQSDKVTFVKTYVYLLMYKRSYRSEGMKAEDLMITVCHRGPIFALHGNSASVVAIGMLHPAAL